MFMNRAQVAGILRIVIPALCVFLAAHGFAWLADVEVQNDVITVALSLAAVVWSYFAHSNAGVLKTAAQIDPGVNIQVPDHVVAKSEAVKKLVDDNNKWPQIQGVQK